MLHRTNTASCLLRDNGDKRLLQEKVLVVQDLVVAFMTHNTRVFSTFPRGGCIQTLSTVHGVLEVSQAP
jgi:hypothetical protein